MKTRLGALVLALVLMLAMIPAVGAQSPAYQASFTTSITYQNVETEDSSIQIDFYNESSATPIQLSQPDLAGGAWVLRSSSGTSTALTTAFRGSAVLAQTAVSWQRWCKCLRAATR